MIRIKVQGIVMCFDLMRRVEEITQLGPNIVMKMEQKLKKEKILWATKVSAEAHSRGKLSISM